MNSKWLWALLAGLLGVGVYAGNILATPPSNVSTTTVSRGLFDEVKVHTHNFRPHKVMIKTKDLSDVYVIRNGFPAGAHTGWHTHPGPSLITVTAGQITAYEGDDPSCTPTVYGVGQGFVDPGDGHVHLLRNEGSVAAETVAFQIIPQNAPRRIDAPAPGNCPF